MFEYCELHVDRYVFMLFFPYLIEEVVHESSFDGDVDVIGPDVVIVALRLDKENNSSASDKLTTAHLIRHIIRYSVTENIKKVIQKYL